MLPLRSAAALALGLALTSATAHAQTPPASPAPDAASSQGGGWRRGDGPRTPPTPEQVEARRAMREACAADMQKLCGDAQAESPEGAQPGGRRSFQCMREHRSELSAGCTQAMAAMRAARQSARGADANTTN